MDGSDKSRKHCISLILDHYSREDHEIFSGPDWPNFDSIKNKTSLPDFVTDELLRMYVLPEPSPPEILTYPRYVEFYITNLCNYGCNQCRSFNNFNFKGHYKFDVDLYLKWAEVLPLEGFVILGGEPLLHPDLASWVTGTRSLWPEACAKIDTNGSHITKVKGLHELLVDNNFFLCINVHDLNLGSRLMYDIHQCFGECEEITLESAQSRYNIRFQDLQGKLLVAKSGLLINLRPSNFFGSTIAGTTDWQKLAKSHTDLTAIHIGDAEENHSSCKTRCPTMLEGKFYKCSTMATLPSFLAQNKLQWPHKLLDEYEPLTLENLSKKTIDHLDYPIPQCAYCDTSRKVDISSSIKKRNHRIFEIKNPN